ncbi:MAG: hypothetical protein IT381_29415 [Deltaproteobacteria bacterium]|nr:hypothetical protein [Deltaproteobacteria bacterium]
MSDLEKDGLALIAMLEALIEADLVKTIMNMPHLTLAERRIALGRALKKGIVQELAKQLVNEEASIAAIEGKNISDALAEALIASHAVPSFGPLPVS